MHTTRRGWRGLATMLAAVAVALAPTAGASAETHKKESDTLVIARGQSIDSLNPYFARNVIDFETLELSYETLVRLSAKDYSYVPGLATKWETSADGRAWTFTIRKNSKWSDGKPVTAHDAAFTYQLLIDNEDIHTRHVDFASKLESVEATDDHTLVITTKEPTPLVPSRYLPIIPKHIWEKVDNPAEHENNDPPLVGSGPYQMVEHVTEQFIRFKANKNYWDGKPEFDELVFRYYSSPDAEVAALESGEVDVVGYGSLTPAQFKSLKGQDGITANAAQNRRFVSLVLNPGARTKDGKRFGDGHPALRDVKVRQALHTAIDKSQLVDRVLDGYGDPGVGPVPKIFETLHWDGGDELITFNLEAANKILDDAGYERGKDGIRTMPNGSKPLKFRLYAHSDNPAYASIAKFLEGWWKDLGIEVQTESIEQGPLNDKNYLGEYDISFSGWGISPDPDFLAMHTCAALPGVTDGTERAHETFYCNPDYDKLQDQQTQETDEAERAKLIKEQQRILYRDSPQIYLYYQNQLEAYNSAKIESMAVQPADGGLITGQSNFLWAYHSARPVGSGADSEGGGSGALIAGIVVALLAAGAVGFYVMRRRTAGERE
ncbi:MAG: ABC transporter substrate-binding protein [Micromonosporaceae bacterium]|nr:ABC transporter substrate-binding protein [Micromonosporaceae bacterium]